ncbi:MAG: lytic transglycosylase domain-containing protein [Saprospiraceae bacterium]|nr:lytic transglycosylase domain-containing protein [Saprospiraceae bacterium]HMW38165.1 lytic transglycosylase domain-containing protein [Saprospiraceae bacterium]HMX87704.1 lytic transglycosylase domain-containing protein [Saprospiraceae bacterium]HMZ39519.1 lytic transglycosylase domain-containing protein [Saprospiraceae bacterium]HNA63108.1 lytic transglycosylase domain-containing protein [Saprospiraceae bacterium]
MKNKGYIFSFLLLGFAVGVLFVTLLSNKKVSGFSFDPVQQSIRGIRINQAITFAGEPIPINSDDISERLERELLINTYQHSSTLICLKLANRYLSQVAAIFKEEGLPEDLKYIAVAESALRNAVSSAGAKGIWQFKEATAMEMGLTVNDYIDERNNFEKCTHAAAKYLRNLHERFGTWALACAAYNMGPSALSVAMAEQKEKSFFDLNLSEETNRYLFRILAYKEIMSNPDKFGYILDKSDLYPEYKSYSVVKVDSSINSLADFAHRNGITYRDLKLYNPWLLKSSLINKNKAVYEIRIPSEL